MYLSLTSLLSYAESFTLTFSQSDFNVTRIGDTITVSALNADFVPSSETSGPALPTTICSVLNPFGHMASAFEVSSEKILVASSVYMYANGEPITNPDLYTIDDSKMPATRSELQPIMLEVGNGIQNGYSFSHYRVMPYLYDADRHELYFVSKVTFTPIFTPITDVADSRVASGLPIVLRPELVDFSNVLNREALSTYSSVQTTQPLSISDAERIDFAIITSESLRSAFDELIRWKRMKGIYTKLFTTEEIYASDNSTTDDALKIKRFLYNLYVNNKLQFALLGGNHNIIPARICDPECKLNDTTFIAPPAADLYFSCFDKAFDWDGNKDGIYGGQKDNIDLTPEIAIGRFPFEKKMTLLHLSRKSGCMNQRNMSSAILTVSLSEGATCIHGKSVWHYKGYQQVPVI